MLVEVMMTKILCKVLVEVMMRKIQCIVLVVVMITKIQCIFRVEVMMTKIQCKVIVEVMKTKVIVVTNRIPNIVLRILDRYFWSTPIIALINYTTHSLNQFSKLHLELSFLETNLNVYKY